MIKSIYHWQIWHIRLDERLRGKVERRLIQTEHGPPLGPEVLAVEGDEREVVAPELNVAAADVGGRWRWRRPRGQPRLLEQVELALAHVVLALGELAGAEVAQAVDGEQAVGRGRLGDHEVELVPRGVELEEGVGQRWAIAVWKETNQLPTTLPTRDGESWFNHDLINPFVID